jgi:hypothetical protein
MGEDGGRDDVAVLSEGMVPIMWALARMSSSKTAYECVR